MDFKPRQRTQVTRRIPRERLIRNTSVSVLETIDEKRRSAEATGSALGSPPILESTRRRRLGTHTRLAAALLGTAVLIGFVYAIGFPSRTPAVITTKDISTKALPTLSGPSNESDTNGAATNTTTAPTTTSTPPATVSMQTKTATVPHVTNKASSTTPANPSPPSSPPTTATSASDTASGTSQTAGGGTSQTAGGSSTTTGNSATSGGGSGTN